MATISRLDREQRVRLRSEYAPVAERSRSELKASRSENKCDKKMVAYKVVQINVSMSECGRIREESKAG